MRKKIFFAIAAGFFAVTTIISLDVAMDNRESDDMAYDVSVMMEAYANIRQRVDVEPDGGGGGGSNCSSWGYRNWNFHLSFVDGVDCGCTPREKVTTDCP
ncbi:hypothetical protein [Alkalitalea saponilacus]|uniref:NVEALA protein n=1 Tax=Alkalitalea saponilacus TaxID=889453 RepID=A0A1T5EY32_9BACT|nr:hypothetical protein [Alkalitalea saponilacus]ASB47974.1 hypothetical protein CDL62_01800 [Alkalitalea saponilacus]SKB88842.1 hypothetical protein SAMN03080601_01455 [Alkalitalea saponilacus]